VEYSCAPGTNSVGENMMRAVVLVIPVLCMGGAEKILTQMANWWARQGVTVYLIAFNSKNDFFCLDRSIIKYNIDDFPISKEVSSVWPEEKNNIGRLRTVFQKILNERPEQSLPIISFLSRMNLRTLLAAEGLPCNVVVSERGMPSYFPLSPKEECLRNEIYHKAQKVVCVSERIHLLWAKKLLSLSNSLFIHNLFCRRTTQNGKILISRIGSFFLQEGWNQKSKWTN
jgi:hypothetical protein